MSSMSRRSPVNTGDILKSQYEVRQKLGEGGFGAVYEIYDRKRNQEMAIKVRKNSKRFLISSEKFFSSEQFFLGGTTTASGR